MEALTAAAVAALTVYDMIRDIDPGAAIRSVRLVSSSDGESEEWRRPSGPAILSGRRRGSGRPGGSLHRDFAAARQSGPLLVNECPSWSHIAEGFLVR